VDVNPINKMVVVAQYPDADEVVGELKTQA
jgi:hypothetical protein